jgi:hypothetical protein
MAVMTLDDIQKIIEAAAKGALQAIKPNFSNGHVHERRFSRIEKHG